MSFYTKKEVDELIQQTKNEIKDEMKIFKNEMENQMLSLIQTNFPNFETNPFTRLKGLDYVKINEELNVLKENCEKLQEEVDELKLKVIENDEENEKLQEETKELKVQIFDNDKENEELQQQV